MSGRPTRSPSRVSLSSEPGRRRRQRRCKIRPAPAGRERTHRGAADVAVAIVSEQPLGLGEKEYYAWDEIFGRLRLKELEAYLGAPAAAGAPTTAGAPARRKATAGPTAPAGTWQAATAIFESRKR